MASHRAFVTHRISASNLRCVTSGSVYPRGAEAPELEITEAVLIRDDETALAILHQLRSIGVRIGLDDFGTGYSSQLSEAFPVRQAQVAEIEGSSAIVQAVVNIAAARNMTTTAEGVETEQQRQRLRALGCTEMQGFLFSAARPGPEVRRLLVSDREPAAEVA